MFLKNLPEILHLTHKGHLSGGCPGAFWHGGFVQGFMS